ncbi:hypothetical protein ACFX1S_007782 [Malus domestica]
MIRSGERTERRPDRRRHCKRQAGDPTALLPLDVVDEESPAPDDPPTTISAESLVSPLTHSHFILYR